eukprot:TRINITY_DN28786_c0_g1_i1.p5 TRINITY_DN28786_c0_g1~~TRINITY_DN28786_c0_g1_i1.p5  ORF type:complete len:150 (-),score=12.56 TRINITY_DN28786_c0_g1_i1:1236-1685(-)
MRMLGTSVNVQLGKNLATQRTTGHHTLNSFDDHTFRVLTIEELVHGTFFDAARITGVPVKLLVLKFTASQFDFFGIDDDDVIATIHVRGKHSFMLTTKTVGNNSSKAAKDDVFSVDHEPFALDVARCRSEGFHYFYTRKLGSTEGNVPR